MKMASISATIALAILSFSAQPANAQGQTGDSEQTLLQSANRERAAQGLAPLKWSDTLAEAARQHALRMAQQNTLSHQLPGEPGLADRASRAGARFSILAENVAEGPSAQSIHQQWMNSPPHRANLLDPQLDSVGIAVADRNGTLFAVEDFSLAVGGMSIREQEKTGRGAASKARAAPAGLRRGRPPVLRARQRICWEPRTFLRCALCDPRPARTFQIFWRREFKTGKYHSAVVGACPLGRKSGFSGYRVAVLLYE